MMRLTWTLIVLLAVLTIDATPRLFCWLKKI
jgi:hypothetical protein